MSKELSTIQEFRKRYPIQPNDPVFLLGTGSYGKVVKVEDQVETEWVAVKISEFKGDDSKSLKAEVELAKRVPRHANIARYETCYRLETDTSICDFAIMKYYPDGNLATLLKKTNLTLEQKKDITVGILEGLKQLHKHRIVHRDFKPANILISRDNTGRFIPKIADFGLSKLVTEDEIESSDFDLSDGRGTPSYKAPEQIVGGRVSFNLDLWAFGVILYEMFTGQKPFAADSQTGSEQVLKRQIEKKIVDVDLPEQLSSVPQPYQTVIRRCLVKDIRKRVRKEDELLNLLDEVNPLLLKAEELCREKAYHQALSLYQQVLSVREGHHQALEGINFCTNAIKVQEAHEALLEADTFFVQKLYSAAALRYEIALAVFPTHEEAQKRHRECLTALTQQPMAEYTDRFTAEQEAPKATDLFLPDNAPVTDVLTPPSSATGTALADTSPVRRSGILMSIIGVIGIFLLIGGYFFFSKSSEATTEDRKPETGKHSERTQHSVTSYEQPKEVKNSPAKVMPLSSPTSSSPEVSKEEISLKQYMVAMEKASQSFKDKNWRLAQFWAEVALSARPLDKKASQLLQVVRQRVEKPIEKTSPEGTSKPSAQQEYDRLIEKGIEAIQTRNDKQSAIIFFREAGKLTGVERSPKATEKYVEYISKGDRIFNTEDFDGAKAWYLVAQSIMASEEVKRKIKECDNQL